MARPKNLSRDEMIRRAQSEFWRHGYASLGIRQLEDGTGIGRFAVRTEFGGKEGLFLATLLDYEAGLREHVIEPLNEDGTLDGIIRFLESIVAPGRDRPMRRFGCLVTNTTVEGPWLESKAVSKQIAHHWGLLRSSLSEILNGQQVAGVISRDLDVLDAVDFIIGVVMAANLMNRDVGRINGGKGVVATAVRAIRSWQTTESTGKQTDG